MYFVATCMIVPKNGVTSDGILNTIDSKALGSVRGRGKPSTIRGSPAMHPPEALRHPDQQRGGRQE